MSVEETPAVAKGVGAPASPRTTQLLRLVEGEQEARPATEVAEDALDAAAQEIRQYVGAATLAIACTVGRIVLERFYGGDVAAWHARSRKPVSLRRLAERLKDAHFTASGLSRCMAIHATLQPLGPIAQWRRLTPGHVAVVLPLPPADQAALLRAAEESDWTREELRAHARASGRSPRGGRRRTPKFVGAIQMIVRMTEADGAAFAEIASVADLSPELILNLNQRLMRARANLERLQRAISPKRVDAMQLARRKAAPMRDRARRGKSPT
jgi:hypothetical protein